MSARGLDAVFALTIPSTGSRWLWHHLRESGYHVRRAHIGESSDWWWRACAYEIPIVGTVRDPSDHAWSTVNRGKGHGLSLYNYLPTLERLGVHVVRVDQEPGRRTEEWSRLGAFLGKPLVDPDWSFRGRDGEGYHKPDLVPGLRDHGPHPHVALSLSAETVGWLRSKGYEV